MTDKADKVPKEITEMNARVDKNSMVLSKQTKDAFFTCVQNFSRGKKRIMGHQYKIHTNLT